MKYRILLSLVFMLNLLSAQSVDSIAIGQVDSLLQVARTLTAKRDFDKAIEVIVGAERFALEKLGRESAAYGSCAFNIGKVNHIKGNRKEAEKWYLEAKDIREKVLSKEHTDYAAVLNNLAILYQDIGNYEKSELLHLEAKAIREKALGKEHIDYAASLNNIAIFYMSMGNYEKAEPFNLESKDIREKVLGKEHPEYASSLNNLAILYKNMGNYERAEHFYLEAKDIREKVLGKEHPEYARCLNNLAALFTVMGNYEKAEPLLLKAIAIGEKVHGKEHIENAITLDNLGTLYKNMGNYEKAEPFHLEAKDIREKTLGRDHRDYAGSLSNLAILYTNMGNYEKAEPLYLESKAIQEKVLGKEHPEYAMILGNLALLNYNMGNYEKAELLYLESKVIREKVLGKEHPDYAASLNNLALLYNEMGNWEKAEPLYLESKAIREKVLGKEHPDYAGNLINLAILYSDLGNYEKAEPLYLEAKDIFGNRLKNLNHPFYIICLNNLAGTYEKQTQFLDAELLLEEALTSTQSWLVKATSFLSEKELTNYTAMFQSSAHQLSAYLLARQVNEVGPGMLTTLAYNNALFYKGFLMYAASRLNSPIFASPEAAEINLRLKGYRRRLSAEYTKPNAQRKSIAELEEKANNAEKELARTVAGYAEALRQVKWEDVQAGLKRSEAAIEFVHFKINFYEKTDSMMYAALVILPEAEQPMFIPLFEEKELMKALSNSREQQKTELVAQIYTRGLVPLRREDNQEGLYNLCWKPLDSLLTGKKRIYYSPSGVLHRINFDAIPAGLGSNDAAITLSDRYDLVRLGSTRTLVVPDLNEINATNEIVMYGGIQYDLDTTLSLTDTFHFEHVLASSAPSLDYAFRSLPKRGGDWNYLPGTDTELSEITKISDRNHYPVQAFRGSLATEETVKQLGKGKSSPRVIHFATHGFFFPDPQTTNRSSLKNEELVFRMSDNPMIRSGVMLAGSNYAWKTGKPLQDGMEDGILTAYEISQMNLSNTELVVLSACETGLGDIQGNEGVYGLQRAFKIAGAKYLIMSLWQVPDRETMEFMTTFYKNWLEGKMTIPDAFRKTQREMRDRFFNPYSWAGFVLLE